VTDAVPSAPIAPPEASVVFGDRLSVLQAYAELLATAGVERGLLGPREAPRLWERHLLNCAGLAELLAPGETVADLGAGAGLPGLVLAAARPDLHVVLVEPLLRRADFLTEAVELLGLEQVSVRRARAEDLVGVVTVDAVVARAVAPLDRLAGWALPLLRPGGRLLALKGERAEAELADATAAISRAGGAGARVTTVGVDNPSTWARVVVIERDMRPGGSSGTGPSRPPSRTSRRTGTTTPRSRSARGADPSASSAPRRAPGTSAAAPAAGSPGSTSGGSARTASVRTARTTPASPGTPTGSRTATTATTPTTPSSVRAARPTPSDRSET
jgi:16S rRNA (guanine527-N7)-methyltransferase